jgi:hypothetical protein
MAMGRLLIVLRMRPRVVSNGIPGRGRAKVFGARRGKQDHARKSFPERVVDVESPTQGAIEGLAIDVRDGKINELLEAHGNTCV